MIDEDDDIPSFVVSSGSEHHVSVSEHTGNAKTPHNKVVSHEDETLARKLAFEKHTPESNAGKAPGATTAAHVQAVNTDAQAGANVQKIEADAAPANHQAIPKNAPLGANVQDIHTEVIAPNRQGIHTDALGSNRASIVGPEQDNDNKQNISADTPAVSNRLKIDASAQSANVQALAHDAQQTHRAGIQTQGADDNMQSVAADAAADDNRQKIGAPAQAPNVQSLGKDSDAEHRVGVHTEGVNDNHQAIPTEAAGNNRQTLPDAPASAVGSVKALPSGVNEQDIPTLNETANHQPMQEQGLGDNHQNLGQPNAKPNPQGLDAQKHSANHQAAPQAPGPGVNRQGIDAQGTQDHRETASSEPIERAKVDFSQAAASSTQANPKKKPRTGVTLPGLISDPSNASPEVLDAAAEFHRRVLDIKHNVDNLNHRLTDFEQKQP